MRLRKIIKTIRFTEDIRNELTLGTGVRMNAATNLLQLKGTPAYPTTADLYAITPPFSPDSVKAWIGFDVYDSHTYDKLGAPLTGFGFRLSDGVDQYYHNGADWVVGETNWNTEVEIAGNISSWPANAKNIQIVINPYTTDSKYTPYLEKIKILYSSNVEFQEDLVVRTTIPLFRDNIRPKGELIIVTETETDTIDLSEYTFDQEYDITDIDSVFDNDNDSDHFSDLFSSYNPSTKQITISAPVPAGTKLFVNFLYRPLIAISTDEEYLESARVPAIHITNVDTTAEMEQFQTDYVRNKADNTAIKIPSARQKSLAFSIQLLAGLSKDLHRMMDEVRTLFANNRFITSKALDESYPIYLLTDATMKSGLSESTLHTAFFRFVIQNALYYQERDQAAYVVLEFKTTTAKIELKKSGG